MQGLLASLRLPFALRGLRSATAAASPTDASGRPSDAAARATDPIRASMRPEPTSGVHDPRTAPPAAAPSPLVEPLPGAPAASPVRAAPIEPSVRVSAAHLVDPLGLRVVPFRPSSRWPLRRAAPRIYDPFRGFPLRSAHLADLMDGRAPRR